MNPGPLRGQKPKDLLLPPSVVASPPSFLRLSHPVSRQMSACRRHMETGCQTSYLGSELLEAGAPPPTGNRHFRFCIRLYHGISLPRLLLVRSALLVTHPEISAWCPVPPTRLVCSTENKQRQAEGYKDLSLLTNI